MKTSRFKKNFKFLKRTRFTYNSHNTDLSSVIGIVNNIVDIAIENVLPNHLVHYCRSQFLEPTSDIEPDVQQITVQNHCNYCDNNSNPSVEAQTRQGKYTIQIKLPGTFGGNTTKNNKSLIFPVTFIPKVYLTYTSLPPNPVDISVWFRKYSIISFLTYFMNHFINSSTPPLEMLERKLPSPS